MIISIPYQIGICILPSFGATVFVEMDMNFNANMTKVTRIKLDILNKDSFKNQTILEI